ncbi:MAG: hypothetical protein O6948_07950, partial [Deltaproteobacteria bacterium]|nr:hypothetical protein [Deltaproteobacteria bacterium]
VDIRVSGERADDYRELEAAAVRIDHIFKYQSLEILCGDTAAVLPAYERMQLGILVDDSLDAAKIARGLERFKMVVQIGISHWVTVSFAN